MIKDIFTHIDQHAEAYIERLRALCRQPSIAAQNVGIRLDDFVQGIKLAALILHRFA